jgi:hypothetical protein
MAGRYTLDLCKYEEVEELKSYLNTYWQKDHVLVKSRELFDWQYKEDGYYNFVIGRNNNTGKIDGAMGFIPVYHFDENLKQNNEFYGALWSTNENAGPGLGMAIMKYVWRRFKPTSYLGLGLSEIAVRMYKALKQEMGILDHYYYLNQYCDDYKIATVKKKLKKQLIDNPKVVISEVYRLSEIALKHKYKPVKSIDYMINRYQKHPIYTYRFMGVYESNELTCIWVIRKVNVNNSSCIKIVDMFGSINRLGDIANSLNEFLVSEKAEYIDCLNYGIGESVFKQMGFKRLDHNGKDIIPNYFEPFEKKNIIYEFAIDNMVDDYVIFKGDGDIDRPNQFSK